MSAIAWSTIMAAIQNWVVAASGLNANSVIWSYYKTIRPQAPFFELSVQTISPTSHDWLTSELNPLVFADVVVTSVSAGVLSSVAHGLLGGDGPLHLESGGVYPSPFTANTDYWVIPVDADHFMLSATFVGSGGGFIDNPTTPVVTTTGGSGGLSVISTDDSLRCGKEVVRTANGIREVTITMQCFGAEGSGISPMQLMSDVIASLPLYVYQLDQAGVGIDDLGAAYSQGAVKLVEGHRGGILEPRAWCDFTIYVASQLQGFNNYIDTISGVIQPTTETGTTLTTIPVQIEGA